MRACGPLTARCVRHRRYDPDDARGACYRVRGGVGCGVVGLIGLRWRARRVSRARARTVLARLTVAPLVRLLVQVAWSGAPWGRAPAGENEVEVQSGTESVA